MLVHAKVLVAHMPKNLSLKAICELSLWPLDLLGIEDLVLLHEVKVE